MPNKVKKRQFNQGLSKKLAKLLQVSMQTAMVCDAIARVVGIDKVKAELDKMIAEKDKTNVNETGPNGGNEDSATNDGDTRQADETTDSPAQ